MRAGVAQVGWACRPSEAQVTRVAAPWLLWGRHLPKVQSLHASCNDACRPEETGAIKRMLLSSFCA